MEKTDMATTCRPARLKLQRLIIVVTMGCIVGYGVFRLTSHGFAFLSPPTLPMTLRQYYHRFSVEEDKFLVTYLPRDWTGGINHIIDIPNWITVIVSEFPTAPPQCRTPKCFYLGQFEMDLLNFTVMRHLQGRQKILLGQMAAMILGAEQILSIDIDRIPIDGFKQLNFMDKTNGFVHNGSSIFNPYALRRHSFSTDHVFSYKDPTNPLLYAALRSNQKVPNSVLPDTYPQTFYLSQGSFINLDQMEVVYSHDAFWAMIHPVMRNILGYGELNSFWAQKLVFALGKDISVIGPITISHQNSNGSFRIDDASDDFKSDVLSSLNKFWCSKVLFTSCAEKMMKHLIKYRLFPPESLRILKDYFVDLQAIHYHFPVILPYPISVRHDFKIFLSQKFRVNPQRKSIIKYSNLRKICPGRDFWWHHPVIKDILLIITFSSVKDYENIPLLDVMYRRWFSHIVYCGPGVPGFTDFLKRHHFPSAFLNVYFLDGMEASGLFIQKCMMAAMVMNFRVKGYMQISSDTLLNPWSVMPFPREKISLVGNMGIIKVAVDKMKYWGWWEKPCGKAAWMTFFSLLDNARNKDPLSKTFLETFADNTKPNTAYYCGWSLFYVPSSVREQFIHAANKTLASGLMNELALAAIVLGIQKQSSFHKIKDHSLWGDDSLRYDQLYKVTDVYMYPFQLQKILKTPKGQTFFCNVYLQNSEDQLNPLKRKRGK
ncbi:uncharacterized protein LOC126830892 [Patella vulgata]|uniref:uncharacterized protein LOC126830892 n=1 Tax=Patella vulgata TaxID=6465 RepID=UPI00217F61AB|nr:uncharacterized protein LOC126830892 [Patella vulgata]